MNTEQPPQSIAAIIAEMRGNEFDDPHLDADGIIGARRLARDWADRIEAAAERERQDAMKTALLAKCKVCEKVGPASAPGNAAAMREALMKAKLYFDHRGEGTNLDDAGMAIDAITSIDAALAAPPRNCDRFATEDEAREAYWAYREPLEFNGKPFVAITEWLFAPAE